MHYQVSRNGQTYGPYTLEDLERYLASGNVLPTDLVKSEEMPDWIPVSELLASHSAAPSAAAAPGAAAFPSQSYANPAYAAPDNPLAYNPGYNPAALAASAYPDAPNLHWALVLLFSFLTCSLFMWIWNLVIAAWLKRVQPNAISIFLYVGALVLLLLQFSVNFPSVVHNFGPGIHTTHSPIGGLLWLMAWVTRLVARFTQRAALEEHFNGPEPIGLRLNPVMTFFFGGLYFQYHINRINSIKQAARYGAVRAY